MSTTPKILLLILAVQWLETIGNPLFQGISFQRGFEINFKPFPIKPIAFIKEKWSPFGVFGKKFAIQKRSIDDMVPRPPARVPRPAAPVFEHIEELEEIGTGPLFIVPKPVPKPPVVPVPAPVVSPKPPPPPPVETASPKPPPPLPVPLPIIVNDGDKIPPPLHDESVPHISTNMVMLHPTKVVNSHVSAKGLYTDISRVESVKEYIHSVPVALKPPVPVAPIPKPPVEPVAKPPVAPVLPPPIVPASPPPVVPAPPPPVPPVAAKPLPPPSGPIKEEGKIVVPLPEVPPKEHEKGEKKTVPPPGEPKNEILLKDSALIKGSKMALQFGTVFLTLMAQFFDNARASIDLMTNPPPKFNN